MTDILYRRGFDDAHRRVVAELYDEAFAAKLSPAIPDEGARRRWLAAAFSPGLSFTAFDGDRLVGIAGFHGRDGAAFVGGGWTALRTELGWVRAAWASVIFVSLDRKPAGDELLMDGIVVAEDARGRGIGTGLFAQLEEHARSEGCTAIRLDVVDTNPGARRLYERLGFVAVKTEVATWLRPIMGFSAVTTMTKALTEPAGD